MTDAARIYVRHVRANDRREFVDLMRKSQHLHAPWITPPTTTAGFNQYLRRTQTDDHEGFVLARYEDDRIVGVINLNNIVRGSFLSASLGYYVGAPYLGHGYMVEGLGLLKNYAFTRMNLHRLEANIQPDNHRSLALVQRCGFSKEGLAPDFLFIDGQWRDHERWSCTDTRSTMLPANQPAATLSKANGVTTDTSRARVAMRPIIDNNPPQ